MQDILLNILKGISFDSGQSYFASLTKQLTEVLKADFAIIGKLKDDKIARIQTLAVVTEGELIENFEYDLEHAPCAKAISNSICIHASGIQEIYPQDSFLEAKNIEAYAGIRLLDANGNLYGIMNVLYRHSIENLNVVEFILKVLAVHTSAEINRINIEKELLESERKNRAWIEKSPVCTKILDLDFNLQYMSSAGVQALNIDDITLHYGKPYPLEFYPESFKNKMLESLKKALKTNEVVEQEAPVFDVDGNELWFHSTIIPVLDDKCENDYIMVLSLEITDRKRAEDNLKQSEERFNFAMQGANDGLWDWDLKTDEVYYSPRWKSMLGYKDDEIKHHVSEWKRLLHPDDLDMTLANAEACINDEKNSRC